MDRKVYVPLPEMSTRLEILKLKLSKMPISTDVDINKLVDLTEGYSGAEVIIKIDCLLYYILIK